MSPPFPFRNHPDYNDLDRLGLLLLALSVGVFCLNVSMILLLVKVW